MIESVRSAFASLRILILSLAFGWTPALRPASALASTLAAPTVRECSQFLLTEGDAAFANGDVGEAISKYRSSFYGLPVEEQSSYLGSLPVRKAMRAYDQIVDEEQDPKRRRALLERQRVFLVEFLEAVAATDGATERIGKDVIADLEQIHHSINTALGRTEYGAIPAVDYERPLANVGSKTDTEPRRRDWVGLGLVIGGGTILATGLGVSVGWFTTNADAQTAVDNGGENFGPGTPARNDYLARERTRARRFLISGSVVAGVGLTTATVGMIHMILHRRHTRTITMHTVPVLTPDMMGVAFHRRF